MVKARHLRLERASGDVYSCICIYYCIHFHLVRSINIAKQSFNSKESNMEKLQKRLPHLMELERYIINVYIMWELIDVQIEVNFLFYHMTLLRTSRIFNTFSILYFWREILKLREENNYLKRLLSEGKTFSPGTNKVPSPGISLRRGGNISSKARLHI